MPRAEAQRDPAEDPVHDQVVQTLIEMIPSLQSFVRLRLGSALMSKVSASDIVHSTCVDLLERRGSIDYRGSAPMRAFIVLALERKIAEKLRFWRAVKRDHSRETGLGGEAVGLDPGPDPLDRAIGQETAHLLSECLRKLADRDAEAIALHHLLGMSQEEVAAALGLTLPAARSLLHRARQRLAMALARAGLEPDCA
jgi:RNA polymerase sigma factor (sigma-70 family)